MQSSKQRKRRSFLFFLILYLASSCIVQGLRLVYAPPLFCVQERSERDMNPPWAFRPYGAGMESLRRNNMSLFVPKHLLMWIDQKRGVQSRQSFILQCVFKIMEEPEMNNK